MAEKELKENITKKIPLRKKLLLVCLFCVVIILIVASISAVNIYSYSKIDETTKADVSIVLGAGTNNNEPTAVFKERLNHGVWLYENGYADVLILTGGYGDNSKISDSKIAKEYVTDKGVDVEDVFIEEKSTITQENLYYAKKIMNKNEYNDALIVSDPLHMKRAMLMAEDYNIEAYSSPTRTSKYQSVGTKIKFLSREVFFYVGYKVYRII